MSLNLNKWKIAVLNSVSPSFCAAKWYNASIFLGSGYTGSCHLPLPHQMNPEQVAANPSAIHNTDHKKTVRKMMLDGVRPAECSYCWKVEDIQRDNVSDRVYKSLIYDFKDIMNIKEIPWDQDVLLKTLEISFDRQCNFACSYCNAGYSTTWAHDLEKNGAYQNFIAPGGGGGAYQSDGSWAEAFGKHLDTNPYVDAFFKWWPELSKSLMELRITGGEATVSQNFWRFVEIMHQYDSPNMRFAVNSNLGVSEKALEKLIDMTKTLPVKEIHFFTSNESYGKHAEYIRDGLNYSQWRKNMITLLENANINALTIMMTINNLCLFSITEFLDDMLDIKAKYGVDKPLLDFNILRWPGMMSPLTLPDDLKSEVWNTLKVWYEKNKTSPLLRDGEKAQIERLLDYIEVIKTGHIFTTTDNTLLFHDFKSFFTQYDERRGKNLVETFPKLKEWYEGIQLNKVFEIHPLTTAGISSHEEGEYKAI